MSVINIQQIHDHYETMCKNENYNNNLHMDICNVAEECLHWRCLQGTDADMYTYGEATRRYNEAMAELEQLLHIQAIH